MRGGEPYGSKTKAYAEWLTTQNREVISGKDYSFIAVIREVTGINVPVHMIAVEKNEPFSTGVWKLTDEVLNMAEPINQSAERLVCYLFLNNDGDDEIRRELRIDRKRLKEIKEKIRRNLLLAGIQA